MSESSESACPICTDPMDLADLSFKPCPCGYQMCSFCFKQIQEMNGKCPACRQPYDPDAYKFTPPDQQEIAQQIKSKRKKEKKKPSEPKEVANRKSLANVRVIQRNLVYVTNLSVTIAKEEILRRYEYFGQYGKIEKIVINKNHLFSVNSPYGPSVSAYITFESKNDALACITAIDNFWIENRPLKASFGTTKYCTFFLRNQQCVNPDCMYLHDLGAPSDSFTKDEISSGKHNMVDPLPMASELTEEEMNYIDETAPPTVLPRRYTTPDVPSPCAPGDDSSAGSSAPQDNQGSSHDGLAPARPALRSAMEFRPKNKKGPTPSSSVWASAPSTSGTKSSLNLEEEKDAWPSLESASSSADPTPSHSHRENGRLRKHHAHAHAQSQPAPASQPPTVVTPPPDDEIWEAPPGLRASQLASMAAKAAAAASSSSAPSTAPPPSSSSPHEALPSTPAPAPAASHAQGEGEEEGPTEDVAEVEDEDEEEGEEALNPWGRSFTPTPSPSLYPSRGEDDIPWDDDEDGAYDDDDDHHDVHDDVHNDDAHAHGDHEGQEDRPHVPVPSLLSDRPPGLRVSQEASSLAHERMKAHNIMGRPLSLPPDQPDASPPPSLASQEAGPGPRWWHPSSSSLDSPHGPRGESEGADSPSNQGGGVDPWHPWSLSSSSGLPQRREGGADDRPPGPPGVATGAGSMHHGEAGPRYEWHQPPPSGPFSSSGALSSAGSHSSEEQASSSFGHGSYGSGHEHSSLPASQGHPPHPHDSRQLLRSILPNVNVSFRPSSSPALPPGLNHGARPPPSQPNWQLFQDNPSTPLFGGAWGGTPSSSSSSSGGGGLPPSSSSSRAGGGLADYPPPGLHARGPPTHTHGSNATQVWQNYFFNHPGSGKSGADSTPDLVGQGVPSSSASSSAMGEGMGASPFSRLQQNMNQPLFGPHALQGAGGQEATGPFRPPPQNGMPPMGMFSRAPPSGQGMTPPGLGPRPPSGGGSYESNPFRPPPPNGPGPMGLMMGGAGGAWPSSGPHGGREYGEIARAEGQGPGQQGGFPPSLMNSLWTSRGPMMAHGTPPPPQGYPGMQPRSSNSAGLPSRDGENDSHEQQQQGGGPPSQPSLLGSLVVDASTPVAPSPLPPPSSSSSSSPSSPPSLSSPSAPVVSPRPSLSSPRSSSSGAHAPAPHPGPHPPKKKGGAHKKNKRGKKRGKGHGVQDPPHPNGGFSISVGTSTYKKVAPLPPAPTVAPPASASSSSSSKRGAHHTKKHSVPPSSSSSSVSPSPSSSGPSHPTASKEQASKLPSTGRRDRGGEEAMGSEKPPLPSSSSMAGEESDTENEEEEEGVVEGAWPLDEWMVPIEQALLFDLSMPLTELLLLATPDLQARATRGLAQGEKDILRLEKELEARAREQRLLQDHLDALQRQLDSFPSPSPSLSLPPSSSSSSLVPLASTL